MFGSLRHRAIAIAAMLVCIVVACTPGGVSRVGTVGAVGPSAGMPCAVTRVIDGDTVDLRCAGVQPGVFRARLVGFDTPETHEPRCRAEAEAGRAATQRLRVLLRQADRIEAQLSGTDRYGRRLVRLHLDGRDIAGRMIAEGLATWYSGGRRVDWCTRLV